MDRITPLESKRLRMMIGRVVEHFKGGKYLVMDIAEHTETGEDLVIYKALYDTNNVYARPVKMFLSKVDKNKYAESKQEYRFEISE